MRYPFPMPLRDSLENWPLVGVILMAVALAAVWQGVEAAALVSVLGAAAWYGFGRQQPRMVPAQPGVVLCPADGRIVRIEKARDPYADREALRISVFTSLFNGHANRACVDGVIRDVRYTPGQLVNAEVDASTGRQERNAVVIESNGQLVTLVQVAGFVARRILCWVKPGDTLTRGQRYGLIRFGARVDVYLPPHAVPKVAPGDRVAATTTILATLNPA
ncbi:MAG: phosphatidylserine decarboxylase [Aquabacterium sp.]